MIPPTSHDHYGLDTENNNLVDSDATAVKLLRYTMLYYHPSHHDQCFATSLAIFGKVFLTRGKIVIYLYEYIL
jgi:hypothetical protein